MYRKRQIGIASVGAICLWILVLAIVFRPEQSPMTLITIAVFSFAVLLSSLARILILEDRVSRIQEQLSSKNGSDNEGG